MHYDDVMFLFNYIMIHYPTVELKDKKKFKERSAELRACETVLNRCFDRPDLDPVDILELYKDEVLSYYEQIPRRSKQTKHLYLLMYYALNDLSKQMFERRK